MKTQLLVTAACLSAASAVGGIKDGKRVVSVWRNKAYDASVRFIDTTN